MQQLNFLFNPTQSYYTQTSFLAY